VKIEQLEREEQFKQLSIKLQETLDLPENPEDILV
jgi:hypothetical protein